MNTTTHCGALPDSFGFSTTRRHLTEDQKHRINALYAEYLSTEMSLESYYAREKEITGEDDVLAIAA
jgi:hypothetical protein